MELSARIFCIAVSLIFTFYIFFKVRKNLFSEKESLIWVLFSLIIIIVSIFPGIINAVSRLVGIQYPPSLIFVIGFMFLILIIFRQGHIISAMNEKCKELAQYNALLDERMRAHETDVIKHGK